MLQENYSTKLILSGNRLEIVNYEKEIVRNRPSKGGRKYSYLEPSDQITENRKTSSNRAIMNFKRLVYCNFSDDSCFLTLTFSNYKPKIVDSIESYKIAFNQFMKKLRKQHQHIKHLAVIEFQSDRDFKGIHFHTLLNIKYFDYSIVRSLWPHGHLWVEQVDKSTVDNLISYMTKAVTDQRLVGRRFYLRSKNLKLPTIMTGTEALYYLQNINLCEHRLLHSYCFQSQYLGEVTQEEYELNNTFGNDIASLLNN